MTKASWHLWERFGVELEYMIVDRETLKVRPEADFMLVAPDGTPGSDLDRGAVGWSNELVRHVLEFKCAEPTPSLQGWADTFASEVRAANEKLLARHAMLLPSAAHPFFDPATETHLWTLDNTEIYATYDRIFDCRGHGWSNLQSTHLNLSFAGDAEFGALHAAIRVLLPLLPALAASSPYLDSRYTGYLDARLETYRHNQKRIPSIAGQVIPEAVFTRADYEREIFDKVKADIAPFDTEHVLDHYFLNSRGAIARFDRGAIEIRVVDIQECPKADLAIVETEVAVLRALVHGNWGDPMLQRGFSTDRLAQLFLQCVRSAENTVIDWTDYLRLFGYTGSSCTAGELWHHIATQIGNTLSDEGRITLQALLKRGTLATALLRSLGPEPARESFVKVYHRLARCLARNELYHPEV